MNSPHTTDAPTLSDEQVEEAIASLWQLKKLFDRHSASHVKPLNFDDLLRKPSYREKVLERLSTTKHPEIAAIANRIRQMQLTGSVHVDDQQKRTETQGTSSANLLLAYEQQIDALKEQLSGELENRSLLERKRRRLLYANVFSVSLLFCSIILNLLPIATELLTEKTVTLAGSIIEDTTLRADRNYLLQGVVFVEGNTELTIEPGTRILGDNGSALVVTRNATLVARGTAAEPIIFTSSKPEGSRARGDWGGLVLLGNALVNQPGHIEGIATGDVRGEFGGNDPTANCGVLEYVRIEFAGYEVFVDNELNGLTLGGCGSNTIIRNVQVHRSLDDGIEVFGGTVSLKNIVISGPGDDGFDWDMGWQGNVQFLVIQMHGEEGDNAFEGDNSASAPQSTPVSRPRFYNVTMAGANNQQTAHRGMTIRHGSGGIFANILMVGFPKDAIDLRGEDVTGLINNKSLQFSNILMFDINKGKYFEEEQGEGDDDLGFDEMGYFSSADLNVIFGLDPRLPSGIYNNLTPDFTPQGHSPARTSNAVIPQGEFWDAGARYIGAIRPGAATNWLEGWTAFPAL